MGRHGLIILVVTTGLVFWGCEGGGPISGNGGGGGGPFPTLTGNWEWQYPFPQGNDLWAVDFVNSNLGLAVGSGGAIIRTNTGGQSWSAILPVTSYDLTDVKFVDQQTAFAVGSGPAAGQTVVLRSQDGGLNWTAVDLPGNGIGVTLAVGSADVIYAAGEDLSGDAYFCRSTNGGDTWDNINTGISSGINGLYFPQEAYGFAACQNGRIYLTLNGGDEWAAANGGSSQSFTDIALRGTQYGWATVGVPYPTAINHDQLFASVDAQNWTGIDLPWNLSLRSISVPALNVVIAGGYQVTSSLSIYPVMIMSTDNGAHWTHIQFQSYPSDVRMVAGVDFINAQEGWLVGPSNFVIHTDDAGNSFDVQTQIGVSDWDLMDVTFTSSTAGWAVGATGGDSALVLHTDNTGHDWARQSISFPHPFKAVSFGDFSHGWAVSDGGGIYRSPSGGLGWTEIASGTTNDLNDVYFKDATTGWAVGNLGTLIGTSDGLTWTPVDLGITDDLTSIEFVNDNVGYVAGDNGAFFRTDDGGQTWASLDAPANYGFVALSFVNADTGWAGTTAGDVLRTYDGGGSFQSLTVLGSGNVRDIKFLDSVYGFVCGPQGTIWTSNDRGNMWQPEISGTNRDLNRLFFQDNTEGWVVGSGGTILHRQP
jgi:photosystem II stability/assembly factor-like uncharacterized protein